MWLQEAEWTRLKREDLYALVWEKPLSAIADEFMVSSIVVAGWCRRLKIPRPALGHWSRIAAGKKVARKELRVLTGVPPEIRVRRRIKALEVAMTEPPIVEPIIVPTCLDTPHALVQTTLNRLAKAKVENGFVQNESHECASVYVGEGTLTRALCVLEALLRAVEKAGGSVADDARIRPSVYASGSAIPYWRPFLLVDGIGVPFSIIERRSFDSSKTILVPNGNLQIEIAPSCGISHGIRRVWEDGRVQRVEDVLDQVVVGIWRCAHELRAKKAQQDAWEKEDEEERRTFELEEARREREEEWTKDLETRLSLLGRSRDVRALLDAVGRGEPCEESSERGEWLAWLKVQADDSEARALALPGAGLPDPADSS